MMGSTTIYCYFTITLINACEISCLSNDDCNDNQAVQ